MEYKLKFENGRSCEIYCESDGKPLQDKINAAEERFGSQVKTINGKEVKEHGLGGFLVGAIIGGIAGNAVAKQGLKKTVKQVARKTTSTVKKAVDSVKKKEAPKSKRSNYIPNRLIDSIETKSGKTIQNKDIIDGAHTKSKVLVSKKRVDSQPKDIDKSKKLSLQADYLSARKIKVVNTTYGRKLKGSEIIDGAYVKKGVFADGGAIDSFNFKKFKLDELISILPDGVEFMWLKKESDDNYSDFIKRSNSNWASVRNTYWTISDFGKFELSKGSENIYLDIMVYNEDRYAPEIPYTIALYTKDNHLGLKNFASMLIQKFKDGGSPEARPNFSSMSKEELIEYSKKNNIPYATGWSKETLIDTIEDALDSRYAKGGGVKKLSTGEKLDLIAKRMYGKTYSQLMKKGRVTNGVQGFKRSEESEKVFKQYLKEYAIPGSHSSSYAKGGGVEDLDYGFKPKDLLDEMIKTPWGVGRIYEVAGKGSNQHVKIDVDGKTHLMNMGEINKTDIVKYADGGGVDFKRYKVIIYHGGEQRDQVKYASTLEEARELSFQGEHSEIVDTKTNKLVYEDGGSVEYAKGGVVLDWKYDKSKGKWRVAVYDPVKENAIAFFDRDEEAENYIVKKKLNKLDRYFSQLQKPDVFVSDKGIYVDFISKYNYEISIEMKFNRTTGKYVIGQVRHLTDDWKYDYESVTEVGGFENNSKDFELLKSTTESIVVDTLNKYKNSNESDLTDHLQSALGSQLQSLFDTWKGLSSKKMAKGGTTDKKYYVVDAFKLEQGASKPIVATFNSLVEAKQDAKSRNSSYDPDTKPFIVKDAKYLQSEGIEIFADGGRIDLFETPDEIPSEVQAIMSEYELEDNDYQILEELQGRLETETGYTFDFGLDGTPYGLRPVGVSIEEIQNSEMFANGGGVDDESEEDEIDYNNIASLQNELNRLRRWANSYGNKGADSKIKQLEQRIEYLKSKENKYAKGGMTEHGLRLGDKILKNAPYKLSEYILVEDKRDNKHFVNLDRGERGKAFAKGGVIGQEITFNHWSGDVKRGTIDDVHSTGEYIVQSGFGSMLVNPEDVISISSPEKEKRFLGIFEDGGFVPSGYVVVIANNERLEFPAKYHFDESTQKESLEDIDFEGSPDYKKLYNFISKEFNEWIENSRDYEDMYYGDGDQPAMFNKSGAIWDAIHTVIYEDLVQKKKEGKKAVINLDKYESDFISAFEYEKGGKLKYANGGEVDNRMFNFLQDDLSELQQAIDNGDNDKIKQFFSYWDTHIEKLKSSKNDRMFNFLKDDLSDLKQAIDDGDNDKIEQFFSYWDTHIDSIKMAQGGGVKKLSTGEKLDLIAKRMYGKTYSQLMKKGRVTNGVQGFKRSEESEKVFKQYLKEYAIPGSHSSSYADGGAVKKKSIDFSVMYGSPDWNSLSYQQKLDIEMNRLKEADLEIGDYVMNSSGMAGRLTLFSEKQAAKLDSPVMVKLDKPSAIVFGYDKGWIGGYYLAFRKGMFGDGGSVDSSLLTAEENNILKLILEHPIFDGYKEIQTFTSGGGNYHTMILLSNNHIVTINYESEDFQYSLDTYDSIDQYLDPESFPGEEKGWDNEYYTPDSETRTANANLDNIPEFFDRMQNTFADGGKINTKLLNEIDPDWVELLHKILKDPIFIDYQAISTFYNDWDVLFTVILLKNNHIVYIAWDGMQMTYSYKEFKSIAQFKKGVYDKEYEDYISFDEADEAMPDHNKRSFSFYKSKSSEDIRNFFKQFEK